jgi:hypothetical protein
MWTFEERREMSLREASRLLGISEHELRAAAYVGALRTRPCGERSGRRAVTLAWIAEWQDASADGGPTTRSTPCETE